MSHGTQPTKDNMISTRAALAQLIELNPKLNYTVTEDVKYIHGDLSKSNRECSDYFIHIHYGSDGAGMTKRQTYNDGDLDVILPLAINFVQTL